MPITWDVLGGWGQHNPSLALDFRRFIADVAADFLELQASILRQFAPNIPLTHNCMGTYENVDYSRFGRALDVISFDNYPFSWWGGSSPPNFLEADETRMYGTALQATVMRGARSQKPFFVTEEQASNTGQDRLYGSGTVELYRVGVWQMVANGADGVQFFRWRTTRTGTEQHWEGVLNYDSNTNTWRYRGVQRIGAEFQRATAAVFGQPVRARVALLYSVETRWALMEQQLTTVPVDVIPQMVSLLGAFRANRVGVDAIFVPADVGNGPPQLPADFNLSSYDIVLAPTLYVLPDNVAAAISDFVAQGGALLTSMRSGAKTSANNYVSSPLPGAFANLAGVTMDEWDPLCSLGQTTIVAAAGGATFAIPQTRKGETGMGGLLCEVLVPGADTETLATYQDGYHAGAPVVTRKGRVIYVGTLGRDMAFYEWLAGLLAASVGVPFGPRLPYGVEMTQRGNATLLLNFGGSNATIPLPACGAANCTEVLSGAGVGGAGVVLGPYDVAVVQSV